MLYDLLLIVGAIVALPKLLFSKKYKNSRLERLGLKLKVHPKIGNPVIWMHMVSIGETKAMMPVYQDLKKSLPNAAIFISSVTATGQQEAKRSLPDADGYFFLPLDTYWNMSRILKRLKPNVLILSESDFWPNMLKIAKKKGVKSILLNGKISLKSLGRFSKFPRFTKKLFSHIDLFCMQNDEYAKRFESLGVPKDKMHVTGNLKLSIPFIPLSEDEKNKLKKKFGIRSHDRVLTVGSTHPGEEELILSQVPPEAKILILPRHPQRYAEIKALLQRINNPNFILVEEMGVLTKCFQISEVAILGGSFIPGIGGHNIFEPIQAQIPVIFGPYMETQKELVQIILNAQAGIQTQAHGILEAIESCQKLQENVKKISHLGDSIRNTVKETLFLSIQS